MEDKIQGVNSHSLTSGNSNVTTTQSLYNFQNYWRTDPYWVQPYWVQPNQPLGGYPYYPFDYQPPLQLVNPRNRLQKKHVRPALSAQPECYITVNSSRVKIYGSNAYMPDNTEFELEIFNPSNETIGVMFKMNGKYIADSHLIIYPGKRITLDRFLNDNNKFKFQTYTVEDTTESKSAVAMNGAVQIEFYREHENNTVDLNKQLRLNPITFCDGSFGQKPNSIFFNSGSTAGGIYPGTTLTNTMGDNHTLTNGITGQSHDGVTANYVHTGGLETPGTITTTTNNGSDVLYCVNANTFSDINFNINDYKLKADWLDEKTEKPADIETGMINKGGKSDMEFTEVDMLFESSYVLMKSYKILPLSQKPFETKDLIRSCTKCKKKAKKEHKFCSDCGTKI